jgi:ComF family protein
MKLDFLSFIPDWVFPPACMACRHLLPQEEKRQVRLRLCPGCETLLEPVMPPTCGNCGTPMRHGVHLCADCTGYTFHFTHNKSAFVYDEVLRDILHDIKYRSRKYAASGLGYLWAETLNPEDFDADSVIVPVPLHPAKEKERGFNQAEELAKPIAERLGLPMPRGLLLRVADTPPQSGFNRRSRAENVQNAFITGPAFSDMYKKIILIDDIYGGEPERVRTYVDGPRRGGNNPHDPKFRA